MSNRPFFKNPARTQEPAKFKPYVPQYKVRGLEPEYIASATVPDTVNRVQAMKRQMPRSMENPRIRPAPSIPNNVPYAELPADFMSSGSLPNVGNNIESTWRPNDEVFDMDQDSAQTVPSHLLVDNNQFDERNYANIPEMLEAPPTEQDLTVYDEDQEDTKMDREYFLVLKDDIISSGSLQKIENEVKQLVFGEHPLCRKHEITTDDIVVLKKMKIKVGVFLE